LEPEMAQRVHGVGADLDTGADFLQPRRLLVDLDLVAVLHQEGRRGEAAEAGAGDQNLALRHLTIPRAAFAPRRQDSFYWLADQAGPRMPHPRHDLSLPAALFRIQRHALAT